MIEVRQTERYARWFKGLRDRDARGRVLARIRRLSLGNFGDIESVGQGVWEMRIHHGPGYRVYFTRKGDAAVILLVGGDKRSQASDIETARVLAHGLLEE